MVKAACIAMRADASGWNDPRTMDSPEAIRCQRVGLRRGGRVILDQVDLRVAPGRIVGLLGPNGAGKTSLLRCIVGMLPPSYGRCLIQGLDSVADPQGARRLFGWLPDEPPLEDGLRCIEYLHLHASLRGLPRTLAARRCAAVLDDVDLSEHARRPIEHLSRGMRSRLALAECLLHQPPVLILDEPAAGLDPAQVVALRALLRRLAGHHAVLLATHHLAEAEDVCDELAVLVAGRIRFHGTPTELSAGRGLEPAYLALAGAGA